MANGRVASGGVGVGLDRKPWEQTWIYTKRGAEKSYRQSVLLGDPDDLNKHVSVGLNSGIKVSAEDVVMCLTTLIDEQRRTNRLLELIFEVEGLGE